MLENKKVKKFFLYGILTEILYILFYFIKPLKKIFNDQALTLSNPYLYLIVIIILLLVFVLYILAYRELEKKNIKFRTIFIFFIIFNLTLLFIWPVGSVDIFSYIGWSRVLSEYNNNPYVTPYSAFSYDTFYEQINNRWLSGPTPYGPLFVAISYPLTFLGGNSLLFNLFLFKLFFIIINIFCCYLIHLTFKNIKATFLYAFNPLILFEFSLNGHSDILTIFFLILSLYFLLQKNNKLIFYLLAWVFLLLSVLIKYMTLVLLPLVFIIILFKIKEKKNKFLFFLFSLVLSFIILLVFYMPFLADDNIFSTILKYLFLPINIIHPAGPAPIINILISFFLYNLKINFYLWANIISKILFASAYLIILANLLIKRVRLDNQQIIKYLTIIMLIFLFTFPTWVLSWYYTSLIVLLIYLSTITGFKYNAFIYGTTLLSILYYLVQR